MHKTWSIAALGLSDREWMLLKNTTHLSRTRLENSYVMDDEGRVQDDCKIVILNAENREAKAHWRTLSERLDPPTAVLYASTPPEDSSQLYLLPPLGPAKILNVLDAITQTLREVEQILIKPVKANKPVNGKDKAILKAPDGLRALVVDDSPTVCKQLELVLQNFAIHADVAGTAEKAVVMMAQRKYDLIFLDVVLPGTDGYQACKDIRKNPKTKHTPVIMLTSKSSPFDRVRGSLAGCSTYLTKPVDYNMFRHTVEKYIGTHVAIRAQS